MCPLHTSFLVFSRTLQVDTILHSPDEANEVQRRWVICPRSHNQKAHFPFITLITWSKPFFVCPLLETRFYGNRVYAPKIVQMPSSLDFPWPHFVLGGTRSGPMHSRRTHSWLTSTRSCLGSEHPSLAPWSSHPEQLLLPSLIYSVSAPHHGIIETQNFFAITIFYFVGSLEKN